GRVVVRNAQSNTVYERNITETAWSHTFQLDELAKGLYIVTVIYDGAVVTKKLMLI
ncbi:MAG: T9SS type A sorting domain-containing protein, partial [Bacteroidia bacterium]|nr:T9SS type A sorting domain-containing protein [Bacteroidia bacterium]